MEIIDPKYNLSDLVRTTEGIKFVLGRVFHHWLWKGDPTENWIYHCQPVSWNKENKEYDRVGNATPYAEHMIIGAADKEK